jgi:hypothetical protein
MQELLSTMLGILGVVIVCCIAWVEGIGTCVVVRGVKPVTTGFE